MGFTLDALLEEDDPSQHVGTCVGDGEIHWYSNLLDLYRGTTKCERNPRNCEECVHYRWRGEEITETHEEDYYWASKEVLTEEQVLQDATDDGLLMVPEKKKPLWTLGDEPQGRVRKFGHGSAAGHLDETNI